MEATQLQEAPKTFNKEEVIILRFPSSSYLLRANALRMEEERDEWTQQTAC